MNGRERLLTAFWNEEPDMVPIAPDIDLIAMRWWHEKTDKPWWKVYLYADPTIGEVFIEASKQLGCDIWDYFHNVPAKEPKSKMEIIEESERGIIVKYITETPQGNLRKILFYPSNSPPWYLERPVKKIEDDYPKLQWIMNQQKFLPKIEPKAKVGEMGITELTVGLFSDFWVENRGAKQAIIDFFRLPNLMEEIFKFFNDYVMEIVEVSIKARPDAIIFGGSSESMSLISPVIYSKYSLQILKKATKLCKEAGIPSHQHICGKSREVVEINYNETDLDVMEPLECPPTGNVNLGEVKQKFGDKLCLKGNINTVTLFQGTPHDIEEAVKIAINDAAAGGGFVLSTGDSPGPNTKNENICELVKAGRKYGKY